MTEHQLSTLRTARIEHAFFGQGTDAYDRNAAAASRKGLEPCETCGRGVANGKGFVVIVTDGGGSFLHPEDDTPEASMDPGYMGGYIVGSTCVKQIPAEFRTPYTKH